MLYLEERENLNAIIGGNYTYYLDEEGIADMLDDIFHNDGFNQEHNDSRAAFYHEYCAYNDGWNN